MYILVGEVRTTHGIKGEIKIFSSFENKDAVFKVGNMLYLGKDKTAFKIISYRKHQGYDMVILDGLDSIDKVIPYKKSLVYVKRDEINIEVIDLDFVGCLAFDGDDKIGVIEEVFDAGNGNVLFRIKMSEKSILVPKNEEFILKTDIASRKVYFKNLGGFYED